MSLFDVQQRRVQIITFHTLKQTDNWSTRAIRIWKLTLLHSGFGRKCSCVKDFEEKSCSWDRKLGLQNGSKSSNQLPLHLWIYATHWNYLSICCWFLAIFKWYWHRRFQYYHHKLHSYIHIMQKYISESHNTREYCYNIRKHKF